MADILRRDKAKTPRFLRILTWLFSASGRERGGTRTQDNQPLSAGDYLLGERFSMADVIFGGTVGYMLQFGLLEQRELFTSYTDRLEQRPAFQRSKAKNEAVMKEHGIEWPGASGG